MRSTVQLPLLIAMLIVSASSWAQSFDAMDVFDLEWASNPQVSPDGQEIVYVRRSNDIMTDSARANLWIIDADGENHRPLYSGLKSYTSPRWSPDGQRLAFISNEEGKRQVFVRWMESGETALITNVQESPGSLSWSPDGRWLAFTMLVKAKAEPIAKPRKKPDGAKWAKPPVTINMTRYQYDGRGIVEPAYRHVFVVPADGGSARQLTSGNYHHTGTLSWSPDSSRIFVSANRSDDWELVSDEADIWSIDIATGTLTRITNLPGAERSPKVSPDGKLIVFSREESRPLAYTPGRLAVMDLDGGNLRLLTESLDGDAYGAVWADDSRSVFFEYAERGIAKIGEVQANGRIREITDTLGGETIGRPYLSGSFHAAGGTIAFTRGSAYRPADLAVMTRREPRVLTQLNEDVLAHRTLGEVHEVVYESSFDKQEIQGWYITPPDFDPAKKYPLILEIHGGPHSAYGPHFTAELQLMAAAGYVVFYANHRGSTTYGEDFALLLQYKYSSEEDFADHMSGVDLMIDKGFIDEQNLFIAGGSAGGIATAYAIGLTDRFNAAVAAKPVINWLSKTLTADSSVGQIYHQFPGPPWEHVEHYWRRSPLSLVGNVTTPTLLITGEDDRRTPISETEQFYQALRLQGIDSAMVRLPDTSHGIASRPSRLVTKVDHILAWFERYRTPAP